MSCPIRAKPDREWMLDRTATRTNGTRPLSTDGTRTQGSTSSRANPPKFESALPVRFTVSWVRSTRSFMHVFGLTGGIGTGKSTVARWWSQRGLGLVDADELARAAVAPGSPGLDRVVREFGREVLGHDGTLDRKRMAERVFSDSSARKCLEALVHPLVRELARIRFETLASHGHELGCYEVPLLFEVGLVAELRPIVVVTADADTQLARVLRRDKGTQDEARARISAQWPLHDKVAAADYVIDNGGTKDATAAQADRVLAAICQGFSVSPAAYGL